MPRLFIVFRQYDSDRMAYRLDEHLRQVFGTAHVAISSHLAPGKDARLEIAHYINASHLVLVVIGRRWLSDAGLFDPRDPLHLAVRTALELPGKAVIPLLVEGAVMPDAAQLPPGLQPLAYRTAINIHDDPDFNMDVSRLVTAIQRIEAERMAANPPPQTQTPARSAPGQARPTSRPAPIQQPPVYQPPGTNPLAGIIKFGGRIIARIVGFFGSLIQVVIHQMLRSTVALVMNIVLILLIVGLAVLYISALLNNGLDFGLAFRAVLDQIGGFIGGVLGR